MKLNLGCGGRLLPTAEGWVNVDKAQFAGVDEVADVFAIPWPWPNDSVEEMYAGHLLEHIPHALTVRALDDDPPMAGWVARLRGLDGFYQFFAEVWRVLAPGGTIYCRVPWGLSMRAWQDPTHVRVIVPVTISYLTEGLPGNASPDYALPFRFEAVGAPEFQLADLALDMAKRGRPQPVILQTLFRQWGQAEEMGFRLRAVKKRAGGD